MPKLNGYEAFKIIRSKRPEIPVIALMAYAREEDRKKAADEGFADNLAKPVSKTELLEKINSYLGSKY